MRGFAGVQESGFRVAYEPTEDPTFKPIRARYQESKTLEQIAEEVNAALVLPGVMDIHMVSCGMANAFYDPSGARIILCYELVAYFLGMFRDAGLEGAKLDEATHGALLFAFYHELGHGLVDVLELPVTGREEDAVDQLATVVLVNEGAAGARMALAGAQWFLLQGEGAKDSELAFWDEHSLDKQRYFDISCLVYGHAPEEFEELIGSKGLPRRRASRCPREYTRIEGAWSKLLMPHSRAAAEAKSKPAESPPEEPAAKVETKKAPKPAVPTCEVAIDHVMTTLLPLFLETLSPEEREEFASTEGVIESMRADGLQECRSTPWTEAQRRCVVGARGIDWAEECL
ncbi:MAG: DUF4344 domain-containing metallopeptidase [Myxococcota bacterium]